jgi:hypothetical protein
MQSSWANGMPIIYLILWADKVWYDKRGRHVGHPVTVSLGE